MDFNLTEIWDFAPYSSNEISLYDKTRNFQSTSLAVYLRIKFERALLTNQKVVIIGFEELFPRENTQNEDASIEFAKWLTEYKHQIDAFARDIDAVHPSIVAYFPNVKRAEAQRKSQVAAAIDSTVIKNLRGQEHIKKTLEAIIEMIRDPQRLPKCHGALLYGPPGTGKTFLAHAICCSYPLHFESLRIPDILHAEVGTSEFALHGAFSRAIENQPALIFIDEMEAMFKGRQGCPFGSVENRLASQIILEFDRISNTRVLVLGVTNLIDHLDSALFTSGRFDTKIFVGLPNIDARREILASLLICEECEPALRTVAEKTEKFSAARLSALVDSARRIKLHKELNGESTQGDSLLEIILKDCCDACQSSPKP